MTTLSNCHQVPSNPFQIVLDLKDGRKTISQLLEFSAFHILRDDGTETVSEQEFCGILGEMTVDEAIMALQGKFAPDNITIYDLYVRVKGEGFKEDPYAPF